MKIVSLINLERRNVYMLHPVAKVILDKYDISTSEKLETAISEIIEADLKSRSLMDKETKLKRMRGEV